MKRIEWKKNHSGKGKKGEKKEKKEVGPTSNNMSGTLVTIWLVVFNFDFFTTVLLKTVIKKQVKFQNNFTNDSIMNLILPIFHAL